MKTVYLLCILHMLTCYGMDPYREINSIKSFGVMVRSLSSLHTITSYEDRRTLVCNANSSIPFLNFVVLKTACVTEAMIQRWKEYVAPHQVYVLVDESLDEAAEPLLSPHCPELPFCETAMRLRLGCHIEPPLHTVEHLTEPENLGEWLNIVSTARSINKDALAQFVEPLFLHHSGAFFYATYDDNHTMVSSCLVLDADNEAEVSFMATRKQSRQQGFGSSLITGLAHAAHARGIHALYLSSVPTAATFYEKNGFEALGKIYGYLLEITE